MYAHLLFEWIPVQFSAHALKAYGSWFVCLYVCLYACSSDFSKVTKSQELAHVVQAKCNNIDSFSSISNLHVHTCKRTDRSNCRWPHSLMVVLGNVHSCVLLQNVGAAKFDKLGVDKASVNEELCMHVVFADSVLMTSIKALTCQCH